ncbi:MAG: DUF2834 domain-containing protein [Acidobacteriota bacterium]
MAQRALLAIVLLLFLAQTAVVLTGVGYVGFVESIGINDATRLMFFDLVITLALILGWMYRDAARTGRRFWPYAALTLAFGSAGPLAYLLLAPPVSCPVHRRDIPTSLSGGRA